VTDLMTSPPVAAFDYRIDWRPANRHPGDHVAVAAGDGGAFRGERLLTESAHFRRLSIRSRLRDPLARWWIHEIQQRSAIDLVIAVDVSASMRVGGAARMTLVGDLVESAALAVHRNGDRIGVFAAAARIDPALSSPPALSAARLLPIAERLRRLETGRETAVAGSLDSVDGLRELWRRLPTRRSLVLLVSDFLAPAETWEGVLAPLAGHRVVPVVVASAADEPPPARFGLVEFTDAETGARRVLWMRPALARRLARERAAHRDRIAALFERLALRPLRVRPPFDPLPLTAYFLSHGAPGGAARPPGPLPGARAPAAGSAAASR
jgi:hypothetical protein